ncbi:MAG: histidinol-phosphate aminotransferase family protein [Candidatus Kapabacteria bacterium]|jgi:histidinol-phosphate/aromatic aminotransferase/cobyric acid decarboxylase-like protein|nr:histidinol-phosphate aminotransferase family protein [Candidatus Kapabacteria bacterium]
MIQLNEHERAVAAHLKHLKDQAGTHSPSIFTLAEKIPDLHIRIDACFLSNPYATDLFLDYLKRELIDTGKMRDVLEFYPSQNAVIAEILASCLHISPDNIFIGNGAIEIIQAVLHRYAGKKIIVNIPTFSSYYEFAPTGTEVVYYQLSKDNDYALNIEHYCEFVHNQNPDTVVLINPNNPDGGYLSFETMKYLLDKFSSVPTVIVDESFIHFAFEDDNYSLRSVAELVQEYPNIVVVKSMSKDFGIAGVRAGYAVMKNDRVKELLQNGFLWNSSGLAEYFFRLYVREDFLSEYEKVRVRYIKETQIFFSQLKTVEGIKLYPSLANFGLVEICDGSNAADFVSKLLIAHGIYTRNCSDKIGLEGEFVRIASRKLEENIIIVNAIRELMS